MGNEANGRKQSRVVGLHHWFGGGTIFRFARYYFGTIYRRTYWRNCFRFKAFERNKTRNGRICWFYGRTVVEIWCSSGDFVFLCAGVVAGDILKIQK